MDAPEKKASRTYSSGTPHPPCFLLPASRFLFVRRWLWPGAILLVEPRVAIVELHAATLHEDFLDLRADVDRVARRHDDVGHLPDLDGAVFLVDAEHARRVDRDRLERLFGIEAIRLGEADLVRHVTGAARAAGCPRDLDAGLLQHARVRVHQVVRLVIAWRAGDAVEDDRDPPRRERVGKLPAFTRAVDDHLHLQAVLEPDDVPHLGDGVRVDDDRHLAADGR